MYDMYQKPYLVKFHDQNLWKEVLFNYGYLGEIVIFKSYKLKVYRDWERKNDSMISTEDQNTLWKLLLHDSTENNMENGKPQSTNKLFFDN